jgi:hypothetical protein
MNKSEQIRSLARDGMPVSQIASRLGISYQFAYNVCRKEGLIPGAASSSSAQQIAPSKPSLTVERLCAGGFTLAGAITLSDGSLTLPPLPKCPGVYAYAWSGQVRYIGVAIRSLAQRLYGYCRPGPTQRTNQRMNAFLLERLRGGERIEIYFATPPDLSWNGFKMSGPVGLEAGLISEFNLPQNIRGG